MTNDTAAGGRAADGCNPVRDWADSKYRRVPQVLKQLAARKSVATINRELETGPRLNRVLDARTLTSIGRVIREW